MKKINIMIFLFAVTLFSISTFTYAGTVAVTLDNNSAEELYFTLQSNSTLTNMKDCWLNFNTNKWSIPSTDHGTHADYKKNVTAGTSGSFTYPEYLATKGGARMYISTKAALLAEPSNKNTTILYDKVEMGGEGAIWNTTNVDFIGIPMHLNNTTKGVKVGYNDDITRENIFAILAGLGDYSIPVTDSTDTAVVLRYNSPQHGVGNDTFNGSMLTAISGAISTLESNYTKAKPKNGKDYIYYGNYYFWDFSAVDGEPAELSASCKYLIGGSPFDVTLTNISTSTVVACNIPYTPNHPNTEPTKTSGAAAFAGLIASAINRGVGASPNTWGIWITPLHGGIKGIPIDYYKTNDHNTGEFNKYAKALHDYSKDGKCYALAYDDYFNQDSAITVSSGDSVTIKILPFIGGTAPTANTYPQAPGQNPLPGINPPATYKYRLNLGIPPTDYPFSVHGYLYANENKITKAAGAYVPTNEKNVSITFSETNVSFTVNAKTGVISNKKPTSGFPPGITTAAMPHGAIGGYNLIFSADF